MEGIFKPDFFTPANVYQNANAGYYYHYDTYYDDELPRVNLMTLFETLDPLFIDLLSGAVFEGPYLTGTGGVTALRKSSLQISKNGVGKERNCKQKAKPERSTSGDHIKSDKVKFR